MKPLLCVIMPFYGETKYLKRALDSIINQTFNDFKFLIGFDGPNLIAKQVIQSYNDSRLELIEYPHRGFIHTLNDLMKECSCFEYIARMDADDVADRNRLQIQMDFLQKNIAVSFVTCSYGFIGRNSNLIHLNQLKNDLSTQRVSISDLFLNNSTFDYNFCDPATIYRSEFVKNVGYFDIDIDNERTLQIKLLRKYEGYIIKSILYYCDFNLNSHSNSRNNNVLYKLTLLSNRYLSLDENVFLNFKKNEQLSYLGKYFKGIRIYLALKDWELFLKIFFIPIVFFNLKTWKILYSILINPKNVYRNVSTPFHFQLIS